MLSFLDFDNTKLNENSSVAVQVHVLYYVGMSLRTNQPFLIKSGFNQFLRSDDSNSRKLLYYLCTLSAQNVLFEKSILIELC